MNERKFKILVIFAVLAGVLLNYQNCASQKNSLTPADLADSEQSDGQMDIINPISTGGIQFVQNKAQVSSVDTDLKALGLCSAEQHGAQLSWKVLDEEENILAQGKSLCDRGSFEVVLDGVETLPCDAQLKLKAAFGAKAKTELSISKECE